MKQTLAQFPLAVLLAVQAGSANPQTQPQRPPYQTRDTWYEFMLKQFNKNNVDYGSWLEQHRKAFLDDQIRNADVDHSVLAAVALPFAIWAYVELGEDD